MKGCKKAGHTAEVAKVLWVPRSATLVGAGVDPGATVSTGTGVMADTAPATTAAPSIAMVPQLLTVLHTHKRARHRTCSG